METKQKKNYKKILYIVESCDKKASKIWNFKEKDIKPLTSNNKYAWAARDCIMQLINLN